MTCKKLLYEYSEYMQIPLDHKVPYDEYVESFEKIKAIYLSQIRIIAFVGGCIWGLISLIIIFL